MAGEVVTVRVTMAASGSEVCDVNLSPDATVLQLRKEIGGTNGLPLLRQTLLVGTRELEDNAAVLRDALPCYAAGGNYCDVQLLIRPAEAFLEEVRTMRQSLSRDNDPPIQEAIDRGVVPLYISYLDETTWPDLQYEACWALTNIASGTTEQTRVVVEHGAIHSFVALLRCSIRAVAEQAVWGLGNIAGDSSEFRDAVLGAGAMEELIAVFVEVGRLKKRHRTGARLVRNVCWSLANMCRGKPEPALTVLQPLLRNLKELLHIESQEDLAEACWACSHISDGPVERARCLVELGVVTRLIELLEHDHPCVRTPAIRGISNITMAEDEDVEAVLDAGFLRIVTKLLRDRKTAIRKDACCAMANIVSGTVEQVHAVLNVRRAIDEPVLDDTQVGPAGAIIQALEEILQADGRNEVRNEAVIALTNAISTACGLEPNRRAQLLRLASSFLTVLLVFEHAVENEELTSDFSPTALQQVLQSIVCVSQIGDSDEEISEQCKAEGIETYGPLAIIKYTRTTGGRMLLHALREHEAANVSELAQQVLDSLQRSSAVESDPETSDMETSEAAQMSEDSEEDDGSDQQVLQVLASDDKICRMFVEDHPMPAKDPF